MARERAEGIIREDGREAPRDRESQEVHNDLLITNIRDRPKFYCMRTIVQPSNVCNHDVMDCSLTFTVDRNIFILGVQVPSQIINDLVSI